MVKHFSSTTKWIKKTYWKVYFATHGALSALPTEEAFAMDANDMAKVANDYEWEHPLMAGDMMIQAFGLILFLFFGKVFGDVMRSEMNFGEIIDIVNESMVIEGLE